MKKIGIILLFCHLGSIAFSQTKYYQANDGTIFNSEKYEKMKQEQKESLSSNIPEGVSLHEVLKEVRRNKDSIILSYKWNFIIGNSTKSFQKESNKKNSLEIRSYPINIFLDKLVVVRIEGGVPYESVENDNLKMGKGLNLEKILQTLL